MEEKFLHKKISRELHRVWVSIGKGTVSIAHEADRVNFCLLFSHFWFHPKKERCDARKGSKHPGVPWDRTLLCRTKGSMIMIMDGP